MATTKAYSAQLIAVYTLALQFAKERNEIEMPEYEKLIKELDTLPDKIQEVIDNQEEIQKFAAKQAAAKDVFFIGRGIDYAVSLEGSLKLKEISYIHSEAYAAGELKHGTISLIEDGTLVIGVLTQDELYEKLSVIWLNVRAVGHILWDLPHMAIIQLKTRRSLQYMCQRQMHILWQVWQLSHCRCSDIMCLWQRGLMWINRETWQKV